MSDPVPAPVPGSPHALPWRTVARHPLALGSIAVAVAALLGMLLLSGGGTGTGAGRTDNGGGPIDGAALESLKRATVLLTTHPTNPVLGGWGSGSIVSEDGLILTNAHVAANRAPGLGVLFGIPIDSDTMGPPSPSSYYVYTVQGDDIAVPTWRAELVVADGYLDLAVLRINARADGTPVSARDLDLDPVPLGSVDDIRAGEELTVLGYPGVAESFRVHVTRGAFSNLKDDPRVGPGAWMNTDAKIATGNSGGLAADERGRLVGIPDRVRPDDRDSATAEYVMRPVDLARPLLDVARGERTWDPWTYVVRPSGTERIALRGWTADAAEQCAEAPGDELPTGVRELTAHLEFSGMVAGDHLLIALLAESGEDVVMADFVTHDWDPASGAAGCLPVTFTSGSAFADGLYDIAMLLGPNYDTAMPMDGAVLAVGGDPLSGSPRPSSPATGPCEELPVEEWDGTPGGQLAGVVTPAIPYPPGEQPGGMTVIGYELTTGPTDRASAERVALADRASRGAAADLAARWLVIEVDGAHRAFTATVFAPRVSRLGDRVTPCTLPEDRARVAAVYGAYHDFVATGAYYHAAWTPEGGHVITDGNTGRVVVSGPGASSTPADVPFQAGADADRWLLANIEGRGLGVACRTATPSREAWGIGAISQVVCDASGDWDALAYTLYESEVALAAYWEGRVQASRDLVAPDVCGGPTWHYAANAADPKGGLLCERLVTADGTRLAQVEWTEQDWRIAAFVNTGRHELAGLWATWTRANSLPRAP